MGIKMIVLNTPEDVGSFAADLFELEIKARPACVLGLATGSTPLPLYRQLVARCKEGRIDFSRVRTFNLDEYVGVQPDSEQSYRHYMEKYLFSRVNIDRANTFIPDGAAPDPERAASDFEEELSARGGIGLQLLGLGNNGHIGFNEPLSSFASRTRVVPLAPHTREQNAGNFGGDPENVPTTAITMGVGTILEAKEALLIVTGAHKAEILARVVEGPLASRVTATALQLHPNCHVLVDEDAAAQLEMSDFIRGSAVHHPLWKNYLNA